MNLYRLTVDINHPEYEEDLYCYTNVEEKNKTYRLTVGSVKKAEIGKVIHSENNLSAWTYLLSLDDVQEARKEIFNELTKKIQFRHEHILENLDTLGKFDPNKQLELPAEKDEDEE